ncbi:Ring finger and CHY zinc finger domain containing 1 [Carabus blaptoides fortunei]
MDTESTTGCKHYKRRVILIAPCCSRRYSCRFCHDENENHPIPRFAIGKLVCALCKTVQNVRTTCKACGIRFGKYVCLICNLFDDEDKGQFHCKACDLCRIGGEHNYFHCDRCNMCLNKNIKTTHKCIENAAKRQCPICLDNDMHSSREPLHVPACGHLLHKKCWEQLQASAHTACPICQAK